MIKYIHGNLFNSNAQVIVNPVNTVGIMGKGLALKFKRRYPRMFKHYYYFCKYGYLTVGKLWLCTFTHPWVLNFPTKQNWRDASKLSYVRLGLQKFVNNYQRLHISSIAFPKIGAGLGGLDWKTQVQPLMTKYLSNLPINVYIYIY